MRFPRLMLAASGLATVALLGSSAAANAAATINGPFPNIGEAGYQVQSAVQFNEVRATIHVPAGSTTSSFIALQQTVNGGKTYAIGLYADAAGNFILAVVEGITVNTATGVPLPVSVIAPHIIPLPTLGAPAGTPLFSNQTGGSYYVELHYSTKESLVQYIAGPTETDAAVLNVAPDLGFTFNEAFHAPAVETLNFGGINLPISTPQASFTRVGLTEPAGWNTGGIAGTRVTFDYFALDEAEATGNGGGITIGNPATLLPSPALPGVGSAFGVITGA
jgi:hypothetical protein